MLNPEQRPWFVVRTQVNRERWAAENIARQGGFAYLPLITETGFQRREGGRRTKVLKARPLFPTYLLVLTEGRWYFLLSTFGVATVLLVGDKPGTVPDLEIQKLKRKELEGIVQLTPPDKFPQGAEVRLATGAFAGYSGLVQGMSGPQRIRVLLDVMGRKTSVLVTETALEAA